MFSSCVLHILKIQLFLKFCAIDALKIFPSFFPQVCFESVIISFLEPAITKPTTRKLFGAKANASSSGSFPKASGSSPMLMPSAEPSITPGLRQASFIYFFFFFFFQT
jgi:hypothetical protein